MGVNIVPHYHLFFTDSHIRRCNDGGLVPEEEGGGEEARSKGCRPPILQEVHLPLLQEADPSWSPHLFTDLVSFGSRHLVRCLPAGVAAGGGSRQLPHPLHHPTLGQSQIMEDSKHEPRKSQLSESSADQAA